MNTITHNGKIYTFEKVKKRGSCDGCIFNDYNDYYYMLEECKTAPDCKGIVYINVEKEDKDEQV